MSDPYLFFPCSSRKTFPALMGWKLRWVPWDLSLIWWLSPVLQRWVERFQGGCRTTNPIRLLLISNRDGVFQGRGETLLATQSLPPLPTSLLARFSLPWSKLKGGELRSLCKHVLQDVKDYWAVMAWMRTLMTIPPLRVQPLTGTCARWPSAALGRGGSHEQVTTETWGLALPKQT